MSKLEAATARLNAALDALDLAAMPLAAAQTQAASQGGKIAALLKERDTLLARLAELEDESRALCSTNEEIETRLDSAIVEIRTALGR
jgi:chromosome segregation ATPase